MNTLSWYIYLAEIIPSLSSSIAFLIFMSYALYFIITAITKAWASDIWSTDSEVVEKKKLDAQAKNVVPKTKWLVLTVVAIIFIAIIPSKQTIYLIIASEIGETVAETPQMAEMMGQVQEVINLQIQSLKNENTK